MNRYFATHKKLIISMVVVGVVVFLGFISFGRDEDSTHDENQQAQFTEVTMDGIEQYRNPLGITNDAVLSRSIGAMIEANVSDAKANYSVVIRDGSLRSSVTPSGMNATSALIDIPELRRTFRISVTDDPQSNYGSMYIECPDASELIYEPQPCEMDQ